MLSSFRLCVILSSKALRTRSAPYELMRKARATTISKAVNIHAVFVRQADGASYFAFTQNAALIDSLCRQASESRGIASTHL